MRKAWTVLLASALVVLAGCGSDSKTSSGDDIGGAATTMQDHGGGTATCSPSGTTLTIAAVPNAKLAYDKDCLAAPAGQDFTLTFDNQDNGVPHTVAFLQSHDSSQVFFSTGQVVGPNKMEFKVTANKFPGAGTYHFHCEVHPTQMQGTFIIK